MFLAIQWEKNIFFFWGVNVLTLPPVFPAPRVVHTQPLPEADAGEISKQQPSNQWRSMEKQWCHQNLEQAHAAGKAFGPRERPGHMKLATEG